MAADRPNSQPSRLETWCWWSSQRQTNYPLASRRCLAEWFIWMKAWWLRKQFLLQEARRGYCGSRPPILTSDEPARWYLPSSQTKAAIKVAIEAQRLWDMMCKSVTLVPLPQFGSIHLSQRTLQDYLVPLLFPPQGERCSVLTLPQLGSCCHIWYARGSTSWECLE